MQPRVPNGPKDSTGENQAGENQAGENQTWRAIRWFIAVALAIGSAVVVIGSRFHGGWHVCDSQLTFEGRAVRVCQPYAVADLIPIFILIGLMLLPDLSELEFPGGWKVKVRLHRQELQTAELQREVKEIEQKLTVTASQQQHFNIAFGAAEKALARSEAAVKTGDGHAAEGEEARTQSRESEKEADVDPRANRLAIVSRQLQGLWSDLEAWARVGADQPESAALREWLATPPTERSGSALSPSDARLADRVADWIAARRADNEPLSNNQLAEVQQWLSELTDALDVVRLARNSVVYAPDGLTLDEIESAFGVGERLLNNLEERLWAKEAPDPSAD